MSPIAIQQQIEAFASGTESEFAFPAGLSVEDRKLVKVSAEKLGLSSCSYGMGSERQIHIFKPASSMTSATVKYSVKNTFVDGPLDATEPQPTLVGPAHQSMPAGALQEYLATEEESFGATDDVKVNSEVDTGSTVDSESEPQDPAISIKNTFVHFEADNADPRIVQSMPAGTFAANIEADRAAAAEAAASATTQKGRPSALSAILPFSEDDQTDSERVSAMLFPSTPNAENFTSFDTFQNSISSQGAKRGESVPVVHWTPSTASVPDSITVLPPASWIPTGAAVPSVLGPPQEPLQGLPSAPPMPPQGPLPACFMPGTSVVLQGLANQPDFNGLPGIVSAFDADCGRYNVMIEIGPNAVRRLVKVKSQNLLLAQSLFPAQPHCCPPAQPPHYTPVQQAVVMGRPARASLSLDQMV